MLGSYGKKEAALKRSLVWDLRHMCECAERDAWNTDKESMRGAVRLLARNIIRRNLPAFRRSPLVRRVEALGVPVQDVIATVW